MNIGVVGTGYVGLVAGACFAESGNDVVCVDINEQKIALLNRGEVPIYEPGLEELIKNNADAGRITFSTDLESAIKFSEVIFVAVGTPEDTDGSADLSQVLKVAETIGKVMNGPKIVVNKSTVPVGTADLVRAEISKYTKHRFDVVSNPEFLKEGSAIEDFMKPDRVVIGADTVEAAEVMRELYAPFVRTNNPILIMDVKSAEVTKYTANAMLATRISFMNEVANFCEEVGADVNHVRRAIGEDARIGPSFLFPGVGYGGSCFPKDIRALSKTATEHGMALEIVDAVHRVNTAQKKRLSTRVLEHYGDVKGKHFAMWGLSFKPKTDDMREAPSLTIIQELTARGATVTAYDPEARKTGADAMKKLGLQAEIVDNAFDALKNADALLIVTEWNEFRRPNFGKISQLLKEPVVFDGRNLYEPTAMLRLGFTYYSIGRPAVRNGEIVKKTADRFQQQSGRVANG